MKRDVPKPILAQYEANKENFRSVLKDITERIKLGLGQLAAQKGTRAKVLDARVKRPGKIWKNASKAGIPKEEVFTKIEDILGIRIVCNNLSDIDEIIKMIRNRLGLLEIVDIKDMVSEPTVAGYRATHIRTKINPLSTPGENPIPCEIQIRTLSQDTWARLSRADLYGKKVSEKILTLTKALSKQLSAIDEIAQLVRDEFDKPAEKASDIEDSDHISPKKLALLYNQKYGENIRKWSLQNWVQNLDEAEVETIEEVKKLLDDQKLRDKLNKIANEIRGYLLENSEWVIYSAQVATETSRLMGIKSVRNDIQIQWDEIIAIARGEALSEMPDSIEDFLKNLKSGLVPTEALKELGGVEDCHRCGAEIIRTEQASIAILDYYDKDNTDLDENLENLFWDSGEDVESIDYSGFCQYCGYQMSKDD
jgi:GTP pyrophosphokinase